MNKEQTKEAIKVMQAFVDGKAIEYRGKYEGTDWLPVAIPAWDFHECQYRIKPELHYRPYANADEFFKACRAHGEWIFLARNGVYLKPLKFDESYVLVAAHASCVVKWGYDSLVEEAVWAADGSVCGVKEE